MELPSWKRRGVLPCHSIFSSTFTSTSISPTRCYEQKHIQPTNSWRPIQILLASWEENGKLAQSEPKTPQFQVYVWIWFFREVLSTIGLLWAMCHHNWLIMRHTHTQSCSNKSCTCYCHTHIFCYAWTCDPFSKPMYDPRSLKVLLRKKWFSLISKMKWSPMIPQDCVQQFNKWCYKGQ